MIRATVRAHKELCLVLPVVENNDNRQRERQFWAIETQYIFVSTAHTSHSHTYAHN